MCAVSRPRYDHHKKAMFDGKIGIWPFAYQDVAKRSSVNRSAGTIETKIVEKINRDEIKKMLFDNRTAGHQRCQK